MIVRPASAATTRAARRIIASGGVIAYLTDTLYGLGCDPINRSAVNRVADLKARDADKPILVIISDADRVNRFFARESIVFRRLAREFWGGALTIVERAVPDLPPGLLSRTGTIGVRLPGDERVRDFVRACGGALTATSANPAGREPGATAQAVYDYFADELDLIVDAGAARGTHPSTVIDISEDGAARLIREGAVSRRELERIVRLAE